MSDLHNAEAAKGCGFHLEIFIRKFWYLCHSSIPQVILVLQKKLFGKGVDVRTYLIKDLSYIVIGQKTIHFSRTSLAKAF